MGMAFVHHGETSLQDIEVFKQTMARLLSLTSAMMFSQLEGKNSLNLERGYNILDLSSLDMNTIRALVKEEKKAEVVAQWVKVLIINSINNGVLSVPPPILTRVFQELDVSMGVYHEAERFSQVPFPFPYAATLDLLMILHTLITPFVVINLVGENAFLPIPLCGLVIFVMWNLHLIPAELENPYDGDMNDLDLELIQDDFNAKLRTLCSVAQVPMLVVSAEDARSTLKNVKRRNTQLRRKRRSGKSKQTTVMGPFGSESSLGASFSPSLPTMEVWVSEGLCSNGNLSSAIPDGSVMPIQCDTDVSVMMSTTVEVSLPPDLVDCEPTTRKTEPTCASLDLPIGRCDVAGVDVSALGATSPDAECCRI